MNSGQDTENGKTLRKSKLYWIGVVFFLMMMALLWSLDSSFVYLTLGGAIFCLFMALWRRPGGTHRPTPSYSQFTPGTEQGQPKNVFLSDIQEIFKPKSTYQSSRPKTSVADKNKRAQMIALVTFFTIFLAAFILPIFLTENSSSEDPSEYYNKGAQFEAEGQYDSAIRYYQLALADDPESTEALQNYGNLLLSNERYDEAIAIYNKALDVNPDHEFARYAKALAYYYKKNYSSSLKELLALLEKSPAYYDAMVLAGDDYYMDNRYDSAIYWYEEAYSNGVRTVGLCNVMAYIYDQKGNQEKAIPLYQEALNYDSTRVDIYQRLGELFPGPDGEEYRRIWRELKSQGY